MHKKNLEARKEKEILTSTHIGTIADDWRVATINEKWSLFAEEVEKYGCYHNTIMLTSML